MLRQIEGGMRIYELRIDITCDANANMLYAFNNTVLVLMEQLSECLVHKPLQAASRSADHVRD